MKLTIAPVVYRLKTPIQTAIGVMDVRRGWRVAIESDGVVGRGESMPMRSFGTEAPEASLAALQAFELTALPDSVDEIRLAVLALKSTPAARFAVEGALLEHLARRKNVPVAALFGREVRSQVLVNALIEGDDAAGLGVAAERAVRDGFEVLKVKVAARPLVVDAQRLLSVRRAVGKDIKLRIDANGGWSEATARSALRGLETLELEVCEQPVGAIDIEGLRRLRRAVPCRIAADETMLQGQLFERVLESDPSAAVDVLVLKPMAIGGLIPSLELALRAETLGVESYATTLMDGPLGRAAATHLAAILPGEHWAHGLSTVELLDGVPDDDCKPRRVRITMPTAAGWGVL